jgi:UDPglucose 6-dehydrogenase
VKIGIIGQGFVGSAIKAGLQDFYEVLTYDIDETKCNSAHDQVCRESGIIFICIPTPMRKSGECDTRLLKDVIGRVDRECSNLGSDLPTLVIKSTVSPGTTQRINETVSSNLNVCFSPEFLTEANSIEDFKNQTRIIIGGEGAKKVKQMFRKPFPNIPIVVTKSETAEMVKYFINCFLATKVTFANQMYDICESSNIDYDKVCEYALLDKRIGSSHLAVPGPDGDRGYGGHCFPKDLSAIVYFAEQNNTSLDFLAQVGVSNSQYRNNKDWLEMKGRAVSED